MSTTPTYNEREIKRILDNNGYYRHRTSGSHAIYKNKDNRILTISFNKCNKSKMLIQKLIKDYGLIVK